MRFAYLSQETRAVSCPGGMGNSGSSPVIAGAVAVAQAADGVIVGSAIVRRIAEADKKPRQEVLADVGAFVSELLAALPQ